MSEELAVELQEKQLVAFNLSETEYAVEILAVQEINRLLPITRVPKAPAFIEGVVNLRGNVIPVLDLHKRLGLPMRSESEQTRIIILKVGEITAGIIVDGVTEVLKLRGTEIENAANITTSVDSDFLMGVGKLEDRLIILLNLEQVLGLQ